MLTSVDPHKSPMRLLEAKKGGGQRREIRRMGEKSRHNELQSLAFRRARNHIRVKGIRHTAADAAAEKI